MKDLHTQEQIDEMRRRLYDRGADVKESVRHKLTDTKVNVSRDWTISVPKKTATEDLRESIKPEQIVSETPPVEPVEDMDLSEAEAEEEKPKRHYRTFILLGSLIIFVLVAGISSMFLYFGGNQISSQNILVAVSGPSTVGGGEVIAAQIGVTNHNSVPIESVTLIVKYPSGTRSVGDNPRNLYEERIPVDDIGPGEVINVPVRAAIFGEEHAEKNIEATVEYRIEGSNSMFYKDADALAFRITSSPLVLRIKSIEKVASGQLVDITLTAVSNASSPLNDILISASYPNGFRLEKSEPEPIFGDNVWKIKELLPEGTATIKLQGVVTGLTEETFRINFDAGPSEPDNQFIVGATLAEAKADFEIERPFIDVKVAINGSVGKTAVISEGQESLVKVDIKNTLDETVYDMTVEVIPGGNALDENSIKSNSGFYDSNTETVRWEVSNNSSFDQILPGGTRTLEFQVVPGSNRTTSSYDLVVNVYARRVAESSALETLIGSVRAEAKYSSRIAVGSQASFVSGPVPPKVGETTSYKLTLIAEAGANDMVNTVVETSLPLHSNWLDVSEGDGTVSYNTVSKKLEWSIGDISSGQRKQLDFQVSILPSVSQVNKTPALVNRQTIRANDRFTGALLQDDAPAVTTELSREMGFEKDNGLVER
ncbi:hypothetical protein KC926_01660 [Candidatus Kaiserbacteria bacterium]|nr:hypothetical protein [Candidatus Kaiserbacteria bacterium]